MASSPRIGAVAALAVLLAGLGAQNTPASATALPPAATHVREAAAAGSAARANPATARAGSAASHPAAASRLRLKPAPGFGKTSRPLARGGPGASGSKAADSAAAVRSRSAAAVRAALASPQVPDTCSGTIQPDTVYPCTTPSASGTDTFSLSLTSTTDLLLLRVLDTSGNPLSFTLTAPDDSTVSCQQPSFNQMPQCPTSQAGTYTLQVSNDGGSYTLAYQPLLSDPSCTAASPSFATPALTASLTAGEVGTCYTLDLTAGQILHVNSTSENQDLLVTVYDSTGAQICIDDQGDCPLTGTAPYFVEADAIGANAITYDLELNSITDPQGCLAGTELAYGTAPDTSSADRCSTLTVATAGNYQVYAVSPQQGLVASTLYQQDGAVACTNTYSSTGPDCQLAAGSYDLVADPYPGSPADVGAVFIAADQSSGCTATPDTDFASGPATGTFAGIGEEICLTLPATAGPAVYLFNQPAAGAYSAQLDVVDATGAQVCQSNGYLFTDCTLTGTKPFRIILSGQYADGGYRVLAQSSGSTAGCADWPQSGFGGSWGATVRLTHVKDAACLSIPAKQHATGDMIDYSNRANVVDGAIYVESPSGTNVCIGASSALCSMRRGVAYTALLISSTGKADTYHLVRRNDTSSARCSAPASTAPGGRSTTVELTSDLDSHCLRVTGVAADKFTFEIRSAAPNSAGAVMQVTNASGTPVCFLEYTSFCNATGSTSYQVIVTALGYQGIAITAHVDTWLIATASGFVAKCAAHQLSGATGWAPIRVRMSEAAVGYCAVLTVGAQQQTSIYSPNSTETGSGQPFMVAESLANWAGSNPNICGVGQSYLACNVPLTAAAGEYALLVYPFQLSLPTVYSFQGVCTFGCPVQYTPPVITSVTPSSGPAGSLNKLVVSGTHLNLGVRVELASDANDVAEATPVSLSAGGKALNVLLSTQGVTPGTYDVVQFGVGYTVGTPSPGYLPGAYKVTAAPPAPPVGSFVPDGPVRVLDTSTGTGTKARPVASHAAVSLKVTGVAGVPATGVSAVLLSLTAVRPSRSGTVIAYADGTARPHVTDLSFSAGQASSDQVVVPVRHGRITLYNDSAGRTGLVGVLSGYFTTAGTHGLLTTVTPTRILNTRTGLRAPRARLRARRTLRLTVAGAGGVPKTGVSAVELTVAVRDPQRSGTLTAFADGRTRPGAGQLAFSAGQTAAGLVTVPLRNGKVDLYNDSSGPVDLTVDVTGYFSGAGADFQAQAPARVLNTSTGLGGAGVNVLSHSAADLSLNNLPGWQGTQQDAVLSVTVRDARAGGSLFVFPDGSATPADPNLVFRAGRAVTVEVIVPLTGPSIDFYNDSGGTVQVIADVQGFGVPSG
jgi:hypothetical protein